MSVRRTYRLPPPLRGCTNLRRPVARLSASTRHLIKLLLYFFPDAGPIARNPRVADHTSTDPYDHLAADAITAARHLVAVLDALDRPVHITTIPTAENRDSSR